MKSMYAKHTWTWYAKYALRAARLQFKLLPLLLLPFVCFSYFFFSLSIKLTLNSNKVVAYEAKRSICCLLYWPICKQSSNTETHFVKNVIYCIQENLIRAHTYVICMWANERQHESVCKRVHNKHLHCAHTAHSTYSFNFNEIENNTTEHLRWWLGDDHRTVA